MHRSLRSVRWSLRAVAAAVGAFALVVVAAPAHADTEYDGSATALEIHDLRLELLPELPAGVELPDELADAPRTIVVPDTVQGHAQYQGTDTAVELPHNPLIALEAVEARSNDANGGLVSEASVAGLRLAGGVLSADLVQARCTADGRTIELAAPQASLQAASLPGGAVELEPGTSNPIPGLGTITFNVQEHGPDTGSVANLVLELDSDLSLDALATIPGAARQFEDTLRAVVADLSADLPPSVQAPDPASLSGEPLYAALERTVAQLPTDQVPPELRDLDSVAQLSGTVTIASVTCSQRDVEDPVAAPEPDDASAAPVRNRTGPSGPPLADTGSPVGMAAVGLGGIGLVVGGALTLLRGRRR